jgi:hypothetical protein
MTTGPEVPHIRRDQPVQPSDHRRRSNVPQPPDRNRCDVRSRHGQVLHHIYHFPVLELYVFSFRSHLTSHGRIWEVFATTGNAVEVNLDMPQRGGDVAQDKEEFLSLILTHAHCRQWTVRTELPLHGSSSAPAHPLYAELPLCAGPLYVGLPRLFTIVSRCQDILGIGLP